MRVVVTGVRGQLAAALQERGPGAGHDVIALGRPDFDLAKPETAIPAIRGAAPDIVFAAAAYTAVDRAESEPGLAMAINGNGAGKVAEAAALAGVPLIHISTDYVFDGEKPSPYLESDPTAPLCVYGATKLAGERAVAAASDDHAILRVGWVYSPFGGNFAKTMLRLAETHEAVRVVADQHGGPTSALDIADAVLRVAERMVTDGSRELRGIFHMPPSGEASWAEFAEEIFRSAGRYGGRRCKVDRVAAADYERPARRPMNTRLNGDKLRQAYRISLPHWTESLDGCIERLMTSVAAEAPETPSRQIGSGR